MTKFRKYTCKSCYAMFIKAANQMVTECPKCKRVDTLEVRGEFDRKQPWPKEKCVGAV